jgi:hypothetical protein
MTEAVETAVSPEQLDSDSQTPATEGGSARDDKPANREARYRVERNEARQERDALAARLEQFQTLEVKRLAGDLSQPSDLLSIGGVALSDLTTEDGFVDPDAVASAVADLLEQRPGLARNPIVRAVDRSQGSGAGNTPGKPTDFSGLLNNI